MFIQIIAFSGGQSRITIYRGPWKGTQLPQRGDSHYTRSKGKSKDEKNLCDCQHCLSKYQIWISIFHKRHRGTSLFSNFIVSYQSYRQCNNLPNIPLPLQLSLPHSHKNKVYLLTSVLKRGENYSFYAFDKQCELLECGISGTKAMSDKVSASSFAILKNVNLNTRDNNKYVQIKTSTAKVNNLE